MFSRETVRKSANADSLPAGGERRPDPNSIHGPHFNTALWTACGQAVRARDASGEASGPLFVDLDGTLIASDLLWEAMPAVARTSPALFWRFPLWLARGKAYFKEQLSRHVTPDPASLPYRSDVLAWLHGQRHRGRRLVLATASPRRWAQAVAQHLALFDAVLASDEQVNLKGAHKLEAIRQFCRQRGDVAFDYVGDSPADLPIWSHASRICAVAPRRRLLRRIDRLERPVQVLDARPGIVPAMIRALRPQQWVKNLLLWAPLLLAHQFHLDKLMAGALAMVAFCLAASGVYLLNDWLDVAADRRHPRKRLRPFASGRLPLSWGPPLAAGSVLAGTSLALAALPWGFAALLATYLVLTCLYSLWLKQRPIVDVMLLAGLYTLRILAGGAATQIAVSEWLLAFSVFMFTSLAFAKRYAELTRLGTEGATAAHGRGYLVADRDILRTLGPVAGYLAVMVLALYINSEAVRQSYVRPGMLWATAGLMLYWVTRIWFLAARGQLCEDPVVFAVTDRVSWAVFVASGLLVAVAAIAW